MSLEEQTITRAQEAPAPEKVHKRYTIKEVTKFNWGYVIKRAFNKFGTDGCTDMAAALTYHAVLSIFPALLAVVSLLGVFGRGQETTHAIIDFISGIAPAEVLSIVEGPISQLTSSSAAGLALITGVVGALWTASGYIGAFGRALNRLYGVVEGRPIWKLRPQNLLVTTILVFMLVLMLMVLLMSGGVLTFISDSVPGLDLTAFTSVWLWFRWPIILCLAVALVALLYHGTPNIKQPKLRLFSAGATFALVSMGLAGLGFSFYVSNFGKYNATYGLIGAVIVMLLFIWIMNNVLLLGAEIDAEIERMRELRAGISAEEFVQLRPRDNTQAIKIIETKEKFIAEGKAIRLSQNGLDYQALAQKLEKEKSSPQQ
ncbi:YihY/virulence factor BrkB family protein [Rothia sp. P6271]|uniref:YihY/virulence factor BrkB family protein n=1 Tax=unclassified Rothia (in: high G+C Gram-positive bacteria) TaxID=2689056 RepID=UPI003AD171C7